MNGYDLSRRWFDFCFENPEKINPNHTALYFFCIEHCNRLGWKEKFGLPSTMAKEAIGIHSYNTYIKTLRDLIDFGFIELIQKSKNQYSSNIVALSNFDKANDKVKGDALSNFDNALIKHATKHVKSTQQSIDSINKPITNKPITNIYTESQYKEFGRFNDWINEEASELKKLKEQVTIEQYFKMTEKYDGEQIKSVLSDMGNYKKITNNISVYKTFNNWARRNYDNR